MRVFLSYAREDVAVAESLASVLAENGVDVWWDRNIAGGEEFSDLIEKELAKADAVVVIWSPHSVKSRWVRDEAAIGGDSGRLVPVSIQGVQPPMGFRQFHTLDLGKGRSSATDPGIAALVRSLKARSDTSATPSAASVSSRSGISRFRSSRFIALAVAAVLVVVAGYFLLSRKPVDAGSDRLTVSLLPFEATAGDNELQAIANQARNFMAGALSSGGVEVRTVGEAAKQGNRGSLISISGQFSRINGKLLATIDVVENERGITAFTRQFEVGEADSELLAERVGAQIAGSIGWAGSLIMLEKQHPSKPPVMAELLQQLDFTVDQVKGMQIASNAARASPNSPFARISHGFNVAHNLDSLPLAQRPQRLEEARKSEKRALELAPEFGDAHALWCNLHSETEWADCEKRLVNAVKVDPDAPFSNAFLGYLYRDVGRFGEAFQVIRLTYSRDPYVPTKIAWMIWALAASGDDAGAVALYEKGVRWWPEFNGYMSRELLFGRLESGGLSAIERFSKSPDEDFPGGYKRVPEILRAFEAKSPDAMRKVCSDEEIVRLWPMCMIALAQLGDLDGAFDLANKIYPDRIGKSAEDAETIWIKDPNPSPLEFLISTPAAPMRRDPRFLELARRTGILRYWQTTHLPDFCTKAHEPVCAQIKKA